MNLISMTYIVFHNKLHNFKSYKNATLFTLRLLYVVILHTTRLRLRAIHIYLIY